MKSVRYPWLGVVCLSLALPVVAAGPGPAEKKEKELDLKLAGITIMGEQRTAYLAIQGSLLDVRAGDDLGEWKVQSIEARRVVLVDDEDTQRILALETTAAPEEEEAEAADAAGADQTAAAKAPPSPPVNPFLQAIQERQQAIQARQAAQGEDKKPARPAFQPRRIPDEKIPEGHRRVTTPFGDVLVKDYSQ